MSAPARRLPAALLLLLAVAAGGCAGSLTLTYGNAALGARLAANRYLDLDRDQRATLAAGIDRLHAWHRREALPAYADLLEQTARQVEDGLDRAEVQAAIVTARGHLRTLTTRALEEAGPALATLGERNAARLQARLARGNERYARKHLAGDRDARLRARSARVAKRFEHWVGGLDDAQRARIDAFVAAAPDLPEATLAHRRHCQQVLLRTLRAHAGTAALGAALHPLVVEWEAQRAPDYAARLRERETQFVDLLLDIDRSLSPAQRARAVTRLDDHARELLQLAARTP